MTTLSPVNAVNSVGFVSWCHNAPASVTDSVHRFTILDAIEKASTFLWGADHEHYDRSKEKLVVGSAWVAFLMRLPHVRLEGDSWVLDYDSLRPIIEDKTMPPMSAILLGENGLKVDLFIVET